jgi:hypothetical protein
MRASRARADLPDRSEETSPALLARAVREEQLAKTAAAATVGGRESSRPSPGWPLQILNPEIFKRTPKSDRDPN